MENESNWRSEFPIFQQHPELVYLDSAATSQRLHSVIETMHEFSISANASVHRGVYDLSEQATRRFEEVREKVAGFLNADSHNNIGFTKGTTEAINVVARGFLEPRLSNGDNVIVSILEHHANFLPWQEACRRSDTELRILRLTNGKLSEVDLEKLIDKRTRFVAISHISNTLGRINPIAEIINICKKHEVPVLIDAAQSACLHTLDVKRLECDFLAFSGHKMFGPMGTGVLYVSNRYRHEVKPMIVGGGMIENVSVNGSTYRQFPYNLDAGTPHVQGVIGLGASIDFLTKLDREAARKHIARLVNKFVYGIKEVTAITLLPYFDAESGIVSFNVGDIHAHDVAGFLNRDGIAIRAGMHCTQPLLDELNLPATVRVSFSIYNQEGEVDRLIESLKKLIAFWK